MDNSNETSGVASYITDNILVVPIQVELHDHTLTLLQKELLLKLSKNSVRGVILDVSGVNIIDCENIESINRMTKTFQLMGAKGVITGIKPSIALSLANLGYDPKEMSTAMNLERGFEILQKERYLNEEEMMHNHLDDHDNEFEA